MDLKQLFTFRTVAVLGSFNQAADLLNYAQSTVSEQIKTLEVDLGVKLFNRDGKKNSLTPAGDLFLQYAQKMIDLEEEIRTEIKGSEEVHGSLSIRIPETVSTYFLPPVLKIFKGRFPHVDFHFNSCSCYGLLEELRSGIIDLAFLITKDFRDVDLEIHTLMEVPLMMITYPDNPIAAKSNVQLIDLINEPVFVTSSDCNYYKILEDLLANKKIKLSILYRINSIEAIKQNIAAGTGVALISKIAVHEEISNGSLVELPFEKGPLSANMVMIRLRNKWHPPILEAFMDIIKETLSSATSVSKS
jgi:DNA-binding transcriptional LysR family regulator